MKKIGKLTIKVLIGIVIVFAVFLGAIAATKYYPKKVEDLIIDGGSYMETLSDATTYSILTWNTGYAGLDKSEDFFMDGGKRSGSDSVESVLTNLSKMNETIDEIDADFVLLQEVDKDGKRSRGVNQLEHYARKHYYQTFAINYKNLFVPIPLSNPMGNVTSGIMTLSKSQPTDVKRYSFDGKENFIVQMFELDRCFTISRYSINSKQLVVINAHFSAFDTGGKIREKQLAQMETVLQDEYAKGNYVILGGDFNHELPGTDSKNFTWTVPTPDWVQKFPTTFNDKNYQWAIDSTVPSVRSLEIDYQEGRNFVAVIDGFLVSDNIEIKKVSTYDFKFENTDHNPVLMTFSFKH